MELITLAIILLFTSISNQLELQEQIVESYSKCLLDTSCTKISNNSFCFGNDQGQVGRCKCLPGYELLERNKTHFACLKHAQLGEACEADVQCQMLLGQEAICNKTCRCPINDYLYKDGRCYTSVLLGDVCHNDGNCWMDDNTFGNCVAGKCTCKFDDQVPTETRTNCINARKLGETCATDIECSLTSNMVCREVCKCAASYTLSKNGERCLKAATRFGEYCEEDQQCSTFLEGSLCKQNCTCPDGHHSYGSYCVLSARIGDVCFSQMECIPDEKYSNIANCMDGLCKCLPGAIDGSIGCTACSIYLNLVTIVFGILLTILSYGSF